MKTKNETDKLNSRLLIFRSELEDELQNILAYWSTDPVDRERGGYYGKIGLEGRADPAAVKGSVLHTRILWTFATAFLHRNDASLLTQAHRAYQYIIDHFLDKVNGGIYWSIHPDGSVADSKKQVYALAFAVYALSAYHTGTKKEEPKKLAIALFNLIETHAFDKVYGGYIEALTENWQPIDDPRLSVKDANEKKSMNTHLHILEAYTSLYQIWPDAKLKKQLLQLIDCFLRYIIDPVTNHLHLFFNEQWDVRSSLVSFGHDIEASWLLSEAAILVGDKELNRKISLASLAVAHAACEGLDTDGGLFYEYLPGEQIMIREKHWWPQAEAMLGFFHAWELCGNQSWLQSSFQSWKFIQSAMLDRKGGEWFWGLHADGSVMKNEDKAGFWKCPYHNSRACIGISRRIEAYLKNQ